MLVAGIKFARVPKHLKYKTRHIAGGLVKNEQSDHATYTTQ
ncbi:MBL fold metallo-hydrolase, partial [Staphylococcus aureus]